MDLFQLYAAPLRYAGLNERASASSTRNRKPVTAAISDLYHTKICEEFVDNAFKFSEPGTRVEVTISSDPKKFVPVIADLGRGMTREQVTNLGAYVQSRGRITNSKALDWVSLLRNVRQKCTTEQWTSNQMAERD